MHTMRMCHGKGRRGTGTPAYVFMSSMSCCANKTQDVTLHYITCHLADALIQSDLQ